jgi:hypothetical protein
VSEALARIVDHALEFKREDRYPTAASMRADVQAALALCTSESSTLNVLPASQPPPPSKLGTTTAALADTMVAIPAAAVARSAVKAEPEPRADDPSERPPPPAPSGSIFRLILLCTFAGAAAFLAWENRAALGGLVASSSVPSASASPSASTPASASATSPADAGVPLNAIPDAEPPPDLDAAALLLLSGDAAIDELLDASSDGGDDDDDEDDDDDLDAASEAAAPSPSNAAGPRRAPHLNKVHKKRTTPRRPGHPRRKKRWRW